MFQFVNPIALFASAAVIIPVLIHLWNIQKGKTLKVGSIALLSASSKHPAHSRRITNWPLFLLRCLLLLLLAAFLANPFWQQKKRTTTRGWILVEHDQLHNAYKQYQASIDSLLKAGFELRALSVNYDKINLGDTTLAKSPNDQPSPWSLIKNLDAGLPKKFPVFVFANDQLAFYDGQRPSVQLDLHWNNIHTGNKSITEPAYNFITSASRPKTIKWISSDSGNYYMEDSLPVSSNTDTTPVRITILAGKNSIDAFYLKSAIKAIGQFTGREILVSTQLSGQPQQMIFWLQESAPAGDIFQSLSDSGTLFQYDAGSNSNIFTTVNDGLFTLSDHKDHSFYKYAVSASPGTTIWSLADGRPLLTVEEKNTRKLIHFKGRFNTQWTDLVWQEDFVRALLPIVLPSSFKETSDLRRIDSLQVVPRKNTGSLKSGSRLSLPENKKDLSLPFWIAMLIVFISERLLAHHQIKKQKDA